ncbi:MAG TPA: hypothetical protein EYQ05_02765 [Gammaproteobacteria bacterium]|nr:hypothetical protein [Gammaproteobacteria bacterium]
MAVTRIELELGQASNNGSYALTGVQDGDLVIVAIMGGKDSGGIPTTGGSGGDGPTFSATTFRNTAKAFFALSTGGNGDLAGLSVFARVWDSLAPEQVEFGDATSGGGNGFIVVSYRGTNVTTADTGTQIGVGVSSPTGSNATTISWATPLTEPTGDTTGNTTQVAFVGESRNSTHTNPTATAWTDLTTNNSNGGNGTISVGEVMERADASGVLNSLTMGGGGGRDWRSVQIAFRAGATTTTHSLSDTDALVFDPTATTNVLTAIQTHDIASAATVDDPTATTNVLTAIRTHDLSHAGTADDPTATTSVLTAIQTHDLDHATTVDDPTATSNVLTAVRTHDLSHAAIVDELTTVNVLTANVAHALSSAATVDELTVVNVLTAIQTHDLSSAATVEDPTVVNALTAIKTHDLSHATTIDDLIVTNVITASVTHDLSHVVPGSGNIVSTYTLSSRISAVQTHDLSHVATIDDTTVVNVLTSVQTHDLSHAGTTDELTGVNVLTAVQTHDLSHAATVDELTAVDVITSESGPTTHDLSSAATTDDLTVVNVLTAVRTHDLSHAATLDELTLVNVLTAIQTHDLSSVATVDELTAVNVITGIRTHDLSDSATTDDLSVVNVLTAVRTHDLSHAATVDELTIVNVLTAVQIHDLSSVATTDELTIVSVLTAIQTHDLSDTSAVEDPSATAAEVTSGKIHELSHAGSVEPLTSDQDITSNIIHSLSKVGGPLAFFPTTTARLAVFSSLSHAGSVEPLTSVVSVLTAVQTHDLAHAGSVESLTFEAILFSNPLHSLAAQYGMYFIVFSSTIVHADGSSSQTNAIYAKHQTFISVTIDGVGDLAHNLLKRSEIMSLEEIWNTGLTQLGVGTVDSAVSDQTAQAILLRKVWDNFRKQFVSDHAWNGCKTTAALTALVNSDFKDTTRWGNVFSLPSDYLRALTVNGHPNQAGNAERVMWEIEIVSDTAGAKSRCICTNQSTVKLEYVFDPGDANIGTFLAPAMKHALGLAFAAFVAPNFGKNANEITMIEQKARDAILKARGIDGQESSGIFFGPSELVESRYRSSS